MHEKGNEALTFVTDAVTPDLSYKLVSATVTPRPIAWVSSRSDDGLLNIAPFSSFTYISYAPPKILFSVGPGTVQLKDTLLNITSAKEFCVSMVTEDFLTPMVNSSYGYERGQSEVDLLGIDMQAPSLIKTPYVAGVSVAMECRLDRLIEVGDDDAHRVIIGKVLCFHVQPSIWTVDRIDPEKYRPLGRIGGPLYVPRDGLLSAPAPRQPIS